MDNVSRETLSRLRAFEALVLKWTPKINLISKGDQRELRERHIVDSLQVAQAAESCKHWTDIGSGGGFPGIVVAIYAREHWSGTRFTFIESDQRKCAFLRTAIRELDLNGMVVAARIEDAPRQNADILSARALADLSALLGFTDRHLSKSGIALFQKGANWKKEVEDARKSWSFNYEAIKSRTQDAAVILKIQGVSRD